MSVARAWIAASLLALTAGCGEPQATALCQVPGQLGAGAFAALDCKDEVGCLDGWRFAARSVETMIFCPAAGQQVTEVVSSDPRVMVSGTPVTFGGDSVSFNLAAGEPGAATIEVRGPELVERIELVVEVLESLAVTSPERVVLGGSAALTSTKTGVSGAPLFGRGGYQLTVPPGLTTRAATTATRDCDLAQPDVVITGGAVGTHAIATAAPAPAWSATVDVVPASAVTSARFTTTRIAGSAAAGYSAQVRVVGVDAGGRVVHGVACDWSGSRQAFVANNVCWALVLLETSEPLDLTCSFDGRALGTVRLTTAIVL